MKRILEAGCVMIAMLSALALLPTSCSMDPNDGSIWDDPKFVRIVVPTEMVESGNDGLEIFYEEGQKIKVWEQTGNAVDLEINKGNDSLFFSYSWIPDAVPVYVAFPSTEETLCNDGVFEIKVGTEQEVSSPGKIENFVAVGKVTGTGRASYKSSPIRNITGFLCFAVVSPDITSVNIEAVGGEPMTGKVSVDCSNHDAEDTDHMTIAADETVPSVTLVPSDPEESLQPGIYYAAVLPGTYAQGLRLIVNYKSDVPTVKTIFEGGVTILRSSLVYLDEKRGDDIRVDLKFSEGWPFVEPVVSKEDQEAANFAGDTYTYMLKYVVNGMEKDEELPFFIKGNAKPYSYNAALVSGEGGNSRMTLPAISGRYIRAVRMEVKNSSQYPKGFKLTKMIWKDLAVCPQKAYSGSPALLSFPNRDGVVPEFEAGYYMYFTDANTSISTISILYSKELPTEYDEDPFVNKILEL